MWNQPSWSPSEMTGGTLPQGSTEQSGHPSSVWPSSSPQEGQQVACGHSILTFHSPSQLRSLLERRWVASQWQEQRPSNENVHTDVEPHSAAFSSHSPVFSGLSLPIFKMRCGHHGPASHCIFVSLWLNEVENSVSFLTTVYNSCSTIAPISIPLASSQQLLGPDWYQSPWKYKRRRKCKPLPSRSLNLVWKPGEPPETTGEGQGGWALQAHLQAPRLAVPITVE